ncbi:MAG: hypothetical protein FJ125_12455 [Deltaproteobacteria bacterium]|nr:hypothetical protein [Deltaproteobacteria bacterium]
MLREAEASLEVTGGLGECWSGPEGRLTCRTPGDGEYRIEVRSCDIAGKCSAYSFELVVDKTPPRVRLVVLAGEALDGVHYMEERGVLVQVEARDEPPDLLPLFGMAVWDENALEGEHLARELPNARSALLELAFGRGEHTLCARLFDEVGNASARDCKQVLLVAPGATP